MIQAPEVYTVLDVETTGFSPEKDHVIEIGIVKVEQGIITDTFSSFVKPPCNIPRRITEVTGIANADVSDAPTLNEIMPAVLKFIGSDIVIGHNISFDLSFLFYTFEAPSGLRCIDTLAFAKDCFPELGNHRLETLTYCLSLSEGQTHRALDDALCTQKLFYACVQRANGNPLTVLSEKEAPSIEKPNRSRGAHPETVRPSSVVASTASFDCAHPLYGKRIVLTGELSISRTDAMQMAVDVGATITSGVSSKTNILVVGTQDISLVGNDGLSGKEEKAYALNASGKASIQIIDEHEFLALVGGKTLV